MSTANLNDQVVGRIFYEAALTEDDIRKISPTKSGKVVMEVVLQDADCLNRNKRRYPKAVIEAGMQSEFIKEKLSTNSLLGEFNHPDPSEGLARQMRVDMRNVSHVIKEAYWDPQNPKILLGKVETAGTATGRDLAGLILENNMRCSFSMRGAGDVAQKNGVAEVISPLRIITWDCVHFPSHKTAYMRNMVNESVVTAGMIAEFAQYAAKNSANATLLMEDVSCFNKGDLAFSMDAGKLVFTERATGRMKGYVNLEARLSQEYTDVLQNVLRKDI